MYEIVPTRRPATRSVALRTSRNPPLLCTAQQYQQVTWHEESFRRMADRDWDAVSGTMEAVVRGELSSLPGGDERSAVPRGLPEPIPDFKDRRHTWALTVAYYGPAFASFAWQKDCPLDSVMGCVDAAVEPFLGGRAIRLASAGRTDRGVSAVGQLLSFPTFEDVTAEELRQALDSIRPGALRLVDARKVSRQFHAQFSASWRRYVYLLPLAPHEEELVPVIDAQLAPLVGGTHSYAALGRQLPKGKNPLCTLHAARASRVAPARRVTPLRARHTRRARRAHRTRRARHTRRARRTRRARSCRVTTTAPVKINVLPRSRLRVPTGRKRILLPARWHGGSGIWWYGGTYQKKPQATTFRTLFSPLQRVVKSSILPQW